MDRILDIATKENDVVFDPFGGSGTTFIASELKKRKWIGIELSTTKAITDRFENIERDVEYHKKLRENVNVLFTKESLNLRKKYGHSNGKYRINSSASIEYETGQKPLLELQ
jgi:site-specific DNA-methyltransferase (adenine-specific)